MEDEEIAEETFEDEQVSEVFELPEEENTVKAYAEAKEKQEELLAKLKEEEILPDDTSQDDELEKRLAYLMKQSEIYSHFLGENSIAVTRGRPSKAQQGSTARSRRTEAEEDKLLLKASQSHDTVSWLNCQPRCITGGSMRPYQLEGLNWLVRLHDNHINGILADEMGLGKTLQTISLFAYLRESRGITGPHLVISPKSTISNWLREIQRWCPDIRAIKLLGSKEERLHTCQVEMVPGKFDVVVASNESCLREGRYLKRFKWSYVVIDEAHRIKNENSALAKLVRLFRTEFRLLLTGTPLQNNLHELWALLNFLLPDVFDCAASFDAWFNTSDSTATSNVVKRLHTVLKPFLLRRVKADVEKELPPKKETKLYVGMTAMQRQLYSTVLMKDIESLNASTGSADRTRLLNLLMQCRKVCNHPYLFDGIEPGPPYYDGPHLWTSCGKMTVLDKLLSKLFKQGSRVLLFSQMTRVLDILEDYMHFKGYLYQRIDGSTSGLDREIAMDDFNRPGSDKFIFLLSTRAGGLGINLQTADTVILYDSDWNPQVDLQAMDRAHRIGQTKEVRVFRLITEKSVEEKVIERADRKLFLDAAVIQQGRLAEKHAQLSKGELMTMVRFGADEILSSKDGTITEEDIDVLLRRSEERTEADNQKISTETKHNLANFSISLEDSQEFNLFSFQGEDFKSKRKAASADNLQFINLPQRERSYVRPSIPAGSKPSLKKKKTFSAPDYQFYDRPFFEALVEQEEELLQQKQKVLSRIKELKSSHQKLKKSLSRRQSFQNAVGNESVESAGDLQLVETEPADGASSSECLELEAQGCLDEATKLQQDIDSGLFELPLELQAERDRKKSEAFVNWTRKDLKAFLDALERHGNEPERTVPEVAKETHRSEEEVARYHKVVFERYHELSDWPKMMERIEKGEKRRQREVDIANLLKWKVSLYPNPWNQFSLFYGGQRGRFFTEDNDLFIVLMMAKYGYGAWDEMVPEIKLTSQFRFDWFMRTRNAIDLQKRGELLIRLIERERSHVDKEQTVVGDEPLSFQSRATKHKLEEDGVVNSSKKKKTK